MSYNDRVQDILDKVKRYKMRRRKKLIKAASVALCLFFVFILTLAVILVAPAFVPSTKIESEGTTPVQSSDPSDAEVSGGDESEPQKTDIGFEESRDYLINNYDMDFDVPQLLVKTNFGDALNNAAAAFCGKVVRFGDKIDEAKANTLITVFVNVTDAYSEGYAGVTKFRCPYYYLKFFKEDTEYLFFVFDYDSTQKAFGSNYFAVLEKESFSCLVGDRETEGEYPDITSAAGVKAYYSESFENALNFAEYITVGENPFTARLEGEGYFMTITRDGAGMAVSIIAGGDESRYYRRAGEEAVYKADLTLMRLTKTDGFAEAFGATPAFGLFTGIVSLTFENRALEEQYESDFYDFTDGDTVYAVRFDGDNPGIDIGGTFTAVTLFDFQAGEGATSTDGFYDFDASREAALAFFGDVDTAVPTGLDIRAEFGYTGVSAFTGYILAYGEGVENGGVPESVYVHLKPAETLCGVSEEILIVPGYFVGRLDPFKKYLFVLREGALASPAGLLEIGESGALSSPLGLAYDGGELGLLNIESYQIFYDDNHIAANAITEIFTSLGNGLSEKAVFDLVYTPVDVYSGVAEKGTEVRVNCDGVKLTVQIYARSSGSVYYFRDAGDEKLYRFDENNNKIYPDSSEYLERSMIINYIVSIKSLAASSDFLAGVDDSGSAEITYLTPNGNRLTLVMLDGKLKNLMLNNHNLAEVSHIIYE